MKNEPRDDRRGRPGRGMLVVLFDMGAPIAFFYVLIAAGLSSFTSLLLSAVLPGLSTIYQVLRARHLDALAVFMMSITVITALASLLSGSPRFLLARDGWVTGISGVWLLATSRADPPVVFMFARPLLEGRIGPNGDSWSVLWDRLPAFRRIWRVASVIWGVATIFDAAVRFTMAYTLPVKAVPALNGAQYAVLFVLLQIFTNIYYFRAGLYDSRSALYAPIRAAAVECGAGREPVQRAATSETVTVDDLPRMEFADPGPVRDQVVAAILAGAKTTTTGLVLEYEREGTALPETGWQYAVLDSAGRAAAVIEMTGVRKVRIADIDLRHVLDDGDESVEQWRAAHEEYWHSPETRELPDETGFVVDDDTVVLAQRFRLVRTL
jgi:uncharacterized protein YhfF